MNIERIEDLVIISGKSGVFKTIKQMKNGLIVESLIDKKRFPVFITTQISSIEDITILTTNPEDEALFEVLLKIYEQNNGKKLEIPKDKNNLFDYFESILPEFDKERVYPSDIKKILSWYNTLLNTNYFELLKNREAEKQTEQTEKKEDTTQDKKESAE